MLCAVLYLFFADTMILVVVGAVVDEIGEGRDIADRIGSVWEAVTMLADHGFVVVSGRGREAVCWRCDAKPAGSASRVGL